LTISQEKEFSEKVEEFIALAQWQKEIPGSVAQLLRELVQSSSEKWSEDRCRMEKKLDQMDLEVGRVKLVKKPKPRK